MTDSIDIPASSSEAYQRRPARSDQQSSNNNTAAPSTPIMANASDRSSTPYSSFVSLSSYSSLNTSEPRAGDNAARAHGDHPQKLSAREKGKMPVRSSTEMQLDKHASSSPSSEFERRASLLSESQILCIHTDHPAPALYLPERSKRDLGSSLSKSEHTVVNVGEPDRPRLITCVKASQGFDWNQDIFLPSYISDHSYASDLERRQDPVQEIFITDEEAEMMFPR